MNIAGIIYESLRKTGGYEIFTYNLFDDVVLLTLGRYHLHKGSDLIPETARRIRELGGDFKWLVIGRGTKALEPAVREAGLEDVVLPRRDVGLKRHPAGEALFDLPVEVVVELYAMADLFVFPSRLEGFPRVILESLAAGLPVEATGSPGCGEVVRDGVFGLVAPDDTGAMAQRVDERIFRRQTGKSRHAFNRPGTHHKTIADISIYTSNRIHRNPA